MHRTAQTFQDDVFRHLGRCLLVEIHFHNSVPRDKPNDKFGVILDSLLAACQDVLQTDRRSSENQNPGVSRS